MTMNGVLSEELKEVSFVRLLADALLASDTYRKTLWIKQIQNIFI